MQSNGRVCIIGLDGATFTVLDQWVAAGYMPHLAALMARGSRGKLLSTVPPVTPPAWTSMTTGVNPGVHGVFDFFKWGADGVSVRFVNATDIPFARIWDIAGAEGRTVGAFNVPITFPAWPVNGFMSSGMLTPGPDPAMAYPAELYQELLRRGLADYTTTPDAGSLREFMRELLVVYEKCQKALLYALEKYTPEFFMCVTVELDRIQHIFWPYCDRRLGGKDPRIQALVCEFFQKLDRTIGELIRHFGDDATFYVVSDHGFGPLNRLCRLNNYLAKEGFISVNWKDFRKERAREWVVSRAKRLLSTLRLLEMARSVRGILHGPPGKISDEWRRSEFDLLSRSINWNQTLACVKSRSDTGIYVNLRGRSTNGIVEPGEQYEKVVQDLIRSLQALKDPQDGKPLVSHFARKGELLSGPCVSDAPDIFVALRDGTIEVESKLGDPFLRASMKTGAHHLEGVLVACGPAIKTGATVGANILDVAPTVLYATGLPIPDYMEGRVLDIFKGDFTAVNPIRRSEGAPGIRPAAQQTPSAADAERVKAALRSLGYM